MGGTADPHRISATDSVWPCMSGCCLLWLGLVWRSKQVPLLDDIVVDAICMDLIHSTSEIMILLGVDFLIWGFCHGPNI